LQLLQKRSEEEILRPRPLVPSLEALMKMPMLSPRLKQLLAARKSWFIFLAGSCLLIPAGGNFLLHAPMH
jgi:hypothetical protein